METLTRTRPGFDPYAIQADFPPLSREIRPGVRLVYLDSAATSLKPWPVIQAVREYLEDYPGNVHRGLHALSERATDAFEASREKVARFLGIVDSSELIFTKGTTDAINLVAHSWGRANLKPGDEVVLSILEHHANIVPWQMVAKETGATLTYVEVTADGRLDLDSLAEILARGKTKLVAVTGMSNVLGTEPPLKEVIGLAHRHGALVLVDGAQSIPHRATDAATLGADFLALSAHKMFGPTGIGALYGRRALLDEMEPVTGGGGMIVRVGRTETTWNEIPWKFEAGTPAIAEAIGFGAAVDYLAQFDRDEVEAHERALTTEAHRALAEVEGLRIFGPDPAYKGEIVSFSMEDVHPHDLAQLVDRDGVAIRAGHHCAQPLHQWLGQAATARASFSLYNTVDDVGVLVAAIQRAREVFRRPT